MKISEERAFVIKHTVVYTVLYFIVINLILPLVMGIIIALTSSSQEVTQNLSTQYVFLVYAIGLCLFLLASRGVLKTQYRLFMQNISENLQTVLGLLWKLFLAGIASNLFVSIVSGLQTSGNQGNIVDAFKVSPAYILFVTLVFAPICEELMFRGGFYFSLLKNNLDEKKAMLISSLSFGLIHVLPSVFGSGGLDLAQLLYLLPYSVMGYFFVLAAKRTNNIFGSILMHFLYNLVAVLLMLVQL